MELMQIGVFARAARLSVRVLRNYDQLGLLVPVEVDMDTGYRRYAVDQIPRAALIRRLRDLEVPLTEIAELLAAGTPAQAQAVLDRHRERVTARAAQLERIARQLDAAAVGLPGWLPVYERRRAPQPIARLLVHTTLSGLAKAIGPGYARLFGGLAEQGITPAGPPGVRYLADFRGDDRGDGPDDGRGAAELVVELYVPVRCPPRPTSTIEAGELPGCLLAAVLHEGAYDDVDTAYRSLGRWIAGHDRVLAGPAEELYLVPPAPGMPTAALRTEIAWPVRPAGPSRPAEGQTK